MASSHWIAYHSEARRGRAYPGKGERHEYEIGPERSWLAPKVKGARIWVVVGKKPSREEKTKYYLQATYICDRAESRTGESGQGVWISGPEEAYFDPAPLLNEYSWWSDVSSGSFQGGLVPLADAEAIASLEEHLSAALSGSSGDVASTEPWTDEGTGNVELAELASIGSEEGRRRLVTHYTYERDWSLAKRKIDIVLRQFGRVQCECCEFDFAKAYGDPREALLRGAPYGTSPPVQDSDQAQDGDRRPGGRVLELPPSLALE